MAAAGQKLMAALGAEPGLQPAFERFMAGLGEEPALMDAVVSLMRAHPDATPDQLGELMEKRMAALTEGPVFDRAFDKAFDRVLARPDLQRIVDALGDRVASNAHVSAAIAERLGSAEAQIKARVVERNGGVTPDREAATRLVLDTYFSEARLARWYAELYASPALRDGLTQGAVRLREAPAFKRHTIVAVGALLNDAEFRKRAVQGMVAMMAGESTEAAVLRSVQGVLETPVVGTALADFARALMGDPELGALADETLRTIMAAPEIRASIGGLVADG